MSETPAAAPLSQAEERSQAKLTHIINGIWPAFGGLIFWQINKDKSEFLDKTGRDATNWGIWVLIAITVLSITCIGGFVAWGYAIYLGLQAGKAAEAGELYEYPTWFPRIIK